MRSVSKLEPKKRKKLDSSLGFQEAGKRAVFWSPEAGREVNVHVWAGDGGQALSSRNEN